MSPAIVDPPIPELPSTGAASTEATIHPFAVLSAGLGIVSIFLPPFVSIGVGICAFGVGWLASRDIRMSREREKGWWLARTGMVVGLGMAGAWATVLLVGLLMAGLAQ